MKAGKGAVDELASYSNEFYHKHFHVNSVKREEETSSRQSSEWVSSMEDIQGLSFVH